MIQSWTILHPLKKSEPTSPILRHLNLNQVTMQRPSLQLTNLSYHSGTGHQQAQFEPDCQDTNTKYEVRIAELICVKLSLSAIQ